MTGGGIPDPALDRDTQLRLLTEVDARLSAGPRITVLLIGGAALAVHWGDRLSMDVDIVAPELPDEVLDAAQAVAAKHGIAETWLENPYEVAPDLEPAADLVASGQRLDIHVPCLEYILAMKLYAARLKAEDARGVPYSAVVIATQGRTYSLATLHHLLDIPDIDSLRGTAS